MDNRKELTDEDNELEYEKQMEKNIQSLEKNHNKQSRYLLEYKNQDNNEP